jgi:hypothetical protein
VRRRTSLPAAKVASPTLSRFGARGRAWLKLAKRFTLSSRSFDGSSVLFHATLLLSCAFEGGPRSSRPRWISTSNVVDARPVAADADFSEARRLLSYERNAQPISISRPASSILLVVDCGSVEGLMMVAIELSTAHMYSGTASQLSTKEGQPTFYSIGNFTKCAAASPDTNTASPGRHLLFPDPFVR